MSFARIERLSRSLSARISAWYACGCWTRFCSDDGKYVWRVYAERLPDGYLLALAGAAGLTSRALRPLRRLIDATRTVIDAGDMTARVPAREVWDRLYRGDLSRLEAGHGLGLSLVKAVMEAHGGRVSVESEPGGGARFTVFLPACEARPGAPGPK